MIGRLICWLWRHELNSGDMPNNIGVVVVACPRCVHWVKLKGPKP